VVGSGPVGLLGIGILQDRPISHRKLVLEKLSNKWLKAHQERNLGGA
jgi:hypothetical protein